MTIKTLMVYVLVLFSVEAFSQRDITKDTSEYHTLKTRLALTGLQKSQVNTIDQHLQATIAGIPAKLSPESRKEYIDAATSTQLKEMKLVLSGQQFETYLEMRELNRKRLEAIIGKKGVRH